jgi:hypothetical protein
MHALIASKIIYAIVILVLAQQTPGAETLWQIVSWVFIIIAAMHLRLLLPYRQEKVKESQNPQSRSAFFIFWNALLESPVIHLLVCGLLSIFMEPILPYTVIIPVIIWAIISTYLGINSLNTLASQIPIGELFSSDQNTIMQNNPKLIKALLPSLVIWFIGLIISLFFIMQ